MSKKILFTVLAVCLVQLAYCRVARESATTANPIAEVARVANETWGEIHEALLRISGVSSDAELWNKAQEGFKSFSDGLQSSVITLNEETKPLQGKAEELVKAFTSKVSEVANELKTKNPELFSGDPAKIQGLVDRTIRTVADESQKLRAKFEAEGKELSPKLQATVTQVYEAAVKTANDFKVQAESAINSIAKKN